MLLLICDLSFCQVPPNFARNLTTDLGLENRVMWIDGTANIARTTSEAGVQDIVQRCKQAGITTLVVDVKPVCGEVLYDSHIAPHLLQWQGKTYPDFDVLKAFVTEGHKAGLYVYASFNVLGEGHKYYGIGPGYQHPDWQSIAYVVDRSLVAPNGSKLPIRGENEPDSSAQNIVHRGDFLQNASGPLGSKIAVEVDDNNRVAGIIDPALLGDEPLAPPENGELLVLKGNALNWATNNLRAGDSVQFDAQGKLVPIADAADEKVAVFVNPLNPQVRQYEISFLKEVAQNYDVDGIMMDRLRYADIYNDFSDLSHTAFEKWLGKPVNHWPQDVIQFNPIPGKPVEHGKYFKQWLEFRASVIRQFLRDATQQISAVHPGIKYAVYVGSWFGEYYGVGVNWGSEKFPVTMSWATSNYNETGYAEFLNWISTGCYYPVPTRADAMIQHKSEGATVESAAQLSTTVVANSVPVYAGLYVLNYYDNPAGFEQAIKTAERNSQGVMIFDLSYIYDYNYWNLLHQAFAQPTIPPDDFPDLISEFRSTEDALENPRVDRNLLTPLPAVPWEPGGG